MAATRHNLSRRAVLGAGVGACVAPLAGPAAAPLPTPFGVGLSNPSPASPPALEGRSALRQAQGERVREDALCTQRWNRTLAAYRRAEARVAAFKADEAKLPPARRAYPACSDVEERFGALDSRRFAALRRLLRLAAPDVAALALKLDLAVADMAWELTGCETCLETLAADARRLASRG